MESFCDRIIRFQEHTGMSNNAFATKCGINPSNYAKMIRGQQTFTTRSLIKIGDAFPELNTEWVMTGDGSMLNLLSSVASKPDDIGMHFGKLENIMIPLINIDSVGGVHSQNLITSGEQYVERWVPFPNARPDDVAILQSGDSMAPTIPSGAILQIRKVEGWREYFGYGNVYVLWLTDDRRITKLVRKSEEDPMNSVLCCSYNPDAENEELPKSMIKEVWKVINVLINKGW